MNSDDKSYIKLSMALREIIVRPELEKDLKSSKTRTATIKKLKIDEDIAIEINNILMDLNNQRKTVTEAGTSTKKMHKHIETDRDFLFESFRQLRTAYRSSMTMSIVMFVIGVVLLVTAVIRSFTDPQSIMMTSIIGGIGVVQIVALFYRNPMLQIARTVSNAQQAKMAVVSYLVGISLINKKIEEIGTADGSLEKLIHLTENAIKQLQTYTKNSELEVRTTDKVTFENSDEKTSEP